MKRRYCVILFILHHKSKTAQIDNSFRLG